MSVSIDDFTVFPVRPLISVQLPAVRGYIRDRGLATPPAHAAVDELATSRELGEFAAGQDLVRHQLEFEGLSPIEAELGYSAYDRAQAVAGDLLSVGRQIDALLPGPWLVTEVQRCRLAERRSRVAQWWRFGTARVIPASLLAAGLAALVTFLLARSGVSLVVAAVLLAAVVAVIAAFGMFLVYRRAQATLPRMGQHSDAVWAQSLTALELQHTFAMLRQIDQQELGGLGGTLGSGRLRESALGVVASAQDNVRRAVTSIFWSYRELVIQVVNQAQEVGNQALLSDAQRHLDELVVMESAFGLQPRDIPEIRFETVKDSDTESGHVDMLASMSIVFVTSLVIAGPLVAITTSFTADRNCDYASAQVRIDDCEDLTNLKAQGVDLSGRNLANKDLSGSNLNDTNLSDSTLRKTNLSFTTMIAANAGGASASESTWDGTDAVEMIGVGIDLTNASVEGVDFSDADFSKAKLNDSKIDDSFLDRTNLSAVEAVETTFRRSSLREADLSGANLTNADFTDADLSEAKLDRATLVGTNFTNARLVGVNIGDLDLSQAVLDGVDLNGMDLSGLNFSGTSFAGANFSNANLTNVSFEDANLLGADLTGATISGLKLAGAELGGVSVKALLDGGADLEGVDLSGADLRGLEGRDLTLTGVKLDGVDLRGFDLRNANFNESSLAGANLNGADLRGASLVGTNFSEASLRVTDLSEADFTRANFTNANLGDARALKSNFSEARFAGAGLQKADFSGSNMTAAVGLGANAFTAQWKTATCPNGQRSEYCRS